LRLLAEVTNESLRKSLKIEVILIVLQNDQFIKTFY